MKKIYDLSLPISADLPVWPEDPAIYMQRTQKMEAGDPCNVTSLRFGAHIGTHMDAPYHFIADGRTIDRITPDELIGPAQVVQVAHDVDLITIDVLKNIPIDASVPKILFKTRNSLLWAGGKGVFEKSYVALDHGASQALVEMGMRLIGVDYLSVAPFDDQVTTHNILLGAGVIIVEGLNLSEVGPGFYELIALPIKLRGADGAPSRVVLIGEE